MRRAVSIKAVVAAAIVMMSSAAAMAAVPGWATGAVNVRIAPGTQNQRIDRLVPGEWVEIVECQAGWCYIQHQGPDGWVSANYLAKRDAGPTPFPNPGNVGHPLPPNGNPGPFPPLPNHGQNGHPLPPNGNPGPFPQFPLPINRPVPPNVNTGPFVPFPVGTGPFAPPRPGNLQPGPHFGEGAPVAQQQNRPPVGPHFGEGGPAPLQNKPPVGPHFPTLF